MQFSSEIEGQRDFYNSFLKRIDNNLTMEDVISDYNDGVINGNLIEFKLNINDVNSVLYQSIKYLSSMRIKGKSIPSNIILISLNDKKAYHYKSEHYVEYIEQIYIGSASKNNNGLQSLTEPTIYNYDNFLDIENLIKLLKTNKFTKINIDENCIVGWASRFYKENPNAKKSDFIGDEVGKVKIIGEIRKPDVFKDFIHPYKGPSNIKFQYLMDKLNDDIQKKNLGAFYTPQLYSNKAIELVREAIQRVPYGNDYVIIDRCAGTGNLELGLSDDELSHCIVSTYEYYEYKVLFELLGNKVRHIIPPFEEKDTFNKGTVRGADALSKEYIEIDLLQNYIQDEKCTIILLENPPYAETTSIEHQKKGKSKESSLWKKSYVVEEMKKEKKGTATNDLANAFIWSAFKYYLRQDTDSYIVFSPVKYWKVHHLINKEFLSGFAFNRKHFHTNIEACIMCALWSNKNSDIDTFNIKAYDIKNDDLFYDGELEIKKIYLSLSEKYYDKRKFNDDLSNALVANNRGIEREQGRFKPIYNDNIIGYMVACSSGFDNPDLNSMLMSISTHNGNGFYLRKDNFLEKMPLFACTRYITYNREWINRARIMKSGDGFGKFISDTKKKSNNQFLLKCLLFTSLEMQNHVRTFTGSDGRFYRNEFCLDTTNGDTLATKELKNLKTNESENKLLAQWELIYKSAKNTKNYNNKLTYGIYQIYDELNTFYKNELNKKVYDYPELNGHLNTLRTMLKLYYNKEIVPVLFKYEFLK
ncbi:hypothetical protein NG782_10490 [Aliarcobacter cryaerophilus]|uniref:hypothetical protein n=1 Tax=Aliarcobacter cryaerophilus TaxID=28198 RepID=UPI003DA34AC6